jgi:hypothetical protein
MTGVRGTCNKVQTTHISTRLVRNNVSVKTVTETATMRIREVAAHGDPTHGPPGCIMRTVATFVNSVYMIKVTD